MARSSSPAPDDPGTPPTSMGPDALQAPWRLEYLEAGEEPGASPPTEPGSFLQRYWQTPAGDQRNHVVVRSSMGMILLNRYPYAGGHLLVALGEPRPRLLDYTPEQRAHFWRLADAATDLMERTLKPQGINIGINQGAAAGAGVPQHLHLHLVPRWQGDVNFIAVVGRVRIIPASLEAMAERYREAWARMHQEWSSLH